MSSDKWNGVPLVLVVVENCLDRHAEEDGERVALIWEKDRPGEHEAVTYRNRVIEGRGGEGEGREGVEGRGGQGREEWGVYLYL